MLPVMAPDSTCKHLVRRGQEFLRVASNSEEEGARGLGGPTA